MRHTLRVAPADRPTWTAERVVSEVGRRWGAVCTACGVSTVGQEVVVGLLLGETDVRCGVCLAHRHGREHGEFLEHARRSVARLDCFRAGWEAADRRLDEAGGRNWPDRLPERWRLTAVHHEEAEESLPGEVDDRAVVATYDAGHLGCGELVLELRSRLNALSAHDRLRLIARDPGAPEDLPAWCRLTGHRLVAADPPIYLIARRPDPATP